MALVLYGIPIGAGEGILANSCDARLLIFDF